jgi:NADH:ubiquinone oxidoreductase subunit 6 (subunit J)
VLNILLIVVLPTAVVIAITLLVGRTRKAASGDFDGDSMSFVGGVLSALFTVVLAFYVVFAWQNGDNVSSQSAAEADALVDTYWQTKVEPAPDATVISALVKQYANDVVHHEWPLLDQRRTDPRTAATLTELRSAVLALPTDNQAVNTARETSLQDLATITTNHRDRVDEATGSDNFTWFLLIGTILGAVAMLVFPLLMGLSARPTNVVGMAVLGVTLAVIVFVCVELLHPLHGFLGTDPSAYTEALNDMTANSAG